MTDSEQKEWLQRLADEARKDHEFAMWLISLPKVDSDGTNQIKNHDRRTETNPDHHC